MVKDIRAWLKRRRIAVLMGGRSAERIISLKTGRAIFNSLKRLDLHPIAIDAAKDLTAQLRTHRINFAYVALHGPGGEDGAVQGLLEWLGIPYTGSGVLASALAMDKVASKRLFQAAGLPSAPWFEYRALDPDMPAALQRLGFPCVAKPAAQGSAVGVSVIRKPSEWRPAVRHALTYGPSVVVESFLDGPEITVGVLGEEALPIIEIVPRHDRPFYDFHAKYAPGGSKHILPARISARIAKESSKLAVKACRVLGTRAAARVDLIVDYRRGPMLLEVNTIPGMTETSLLPEAARAAGISFDALVLRIAQDSVSG